MASVWEDFANPDSKQKERPPAIGTIPKESEGGLNKDCDWGIERPECESSDPAQPNSESTKFIALYEQYLSDKQSLEHRTKNHQLYANNPSKALREWFDNEGHEYSHKIEETRDSQYKCSIEVPVGDQDFTLESESHPKKLTAIDEVCLAACKLLDDCDLLKSWQHDNGVKDLDRKRRIDEANKEDDIELDQTKFSNSQEPKLKRNTRESLQAKWTELNMTILGLKAKLVKLDLSVSSKKNATSNDDAKSEDEDDDPLDAFMSNLDRKTELTLDEKIEKSRIKSQISALEREQEDIGELLEEINS